VLTVNTLRLVRVTADVGAGDVGSGPTALAQQILLLRYSADIQLLMNYGRMYDDGTHGDIKANDGRYTLQVSIIETTPQTNFLIVAVNYSGLSQPVFSPPATVTIVAAAPGPGEVLQTIATALEANDLDAVFRHVHSDTRNVASLQSLDASDRAALAEILRTATASTDDGTVAIYLSDGDPIRLARNPDGSWILVSW
jgi:hypothetical protein